MILIGDSGSTKTEWVILTQEATYTYHTQGINPMFNSIDEIEFILREELYPQLIHKTGFQKICFYGASVSSEERVNRIREAMNKVFKGIPTEIHHDLLAAARALCGKEKGIACILGTGSNSCIYDGEKITDHIPSLGYVLGDEGSGAHMGKTLLAEYFYDTIPSDIKKELDAFLDKTKVEVLDFIYRQPMANRYLATLAVFIGTHRNRPEIRSIINRCLGSFIANHVLPYPNSLHLPVHSVGSVGFAFADEFKELLITKGLTPGTIIKTPMPGLINYHLPELK